MINKKEKKQEQPIVDKTKNNSINQHLYRKNYYSMEENMIPNIVGACDGLIFYLTEDKLLRYI